MLRSLTLTNWKSFGSTRNRVEFAPLTLLVGPNASGKSNALDALRFLQGTALDFPIGDVLRGRWEGQREVWSAIRGQAVEAARNQMTQFELLTCWTDSGSSLVSHQVAINTKDDVWIDYERVARGDEDYAFDTRAPALRGASGRQPGGAIKAALRSKGKGNAEVQTFSAARSLLGQVTDGGRVHESAVEDARYIQSVLRAVAFLDIQPARMRDYRPQHASQLGVSGENISPKLNALSEERRNDIAAWLAELCAPAVRSFGFDTTQLREVMLFLEEGDPVAEGQRNLISARSLSDGTLRFLGLITALLTASPGSLVVLEEPDVGLHPARIHLLARLLEQVTTDQQIQVVATTHSPTLLAHLSPEALADVVAMGRDLDGQSVCERLGSLPHFDTLRASNQLDHLVSTGWIERAL